MTRIVLSDQVRTDFERIFEFLFQYAADSAVARIQEIVAAIDILQSSPKIGRPVALGQRELVISRGGGYLALYRYDPIDDTVYVLAVKSQREQSYKL